MADLNDLIIIGLDTSDGTDHELYDERAMKVLDENLVKNILVYGVIRPVTVREEAGKLLVVDGRQRVRAARKARSMQSEAGEYEVKVPYTTHGVVGADRQRLAGIMVSTNEQRSADEILVKAAKAARMKGLGASLDEISIAFGRSKTTIRQWFKLLEAHPTLQDAVKHGLIAVSAAHEVAKYPKDEQVDVLRELQKLANGERVTESMAKAYRQAKGDSTATPLGQATAGVNPEPAGEDEGGLSPAAAALLDGLDGEEGENVDHTPQPSTGTKAKPQQSGVKRTWLRKALNTEAAKDLTKLQRGILTWIATGLTEKGTWYDDFRIAAESEMNQ
jgi:ParB-like chromosome segregation protein Spo0J